MSTGRLRRALRAASRDSGLLALCVVIGVVELGSIVLAVLVVGGRDPLADVATLGIYRLILLAGLALVLPGCYAVHREEIDLRDTPRRAGRALRTDGPGLLVASLVTRTVATIATVLVFVVALSILLGIDTLAVWSDGLLGVGVDRPTTFQIGLVVAAVLAAWVVNGLVAYQDLLVIDDRASVFGAWKTSAAAVVSRPRWYPRQALARGLLLAIPWILAILTVFVFDALGAPDEWPASIGTLVAATAVFVAITAIARATLIAYHVETMDDVVGPAAAGSPTPLRSNLGRVAVASLLVLAAVGGVAAVRAGDVTPGPSVPDATLNEAEPTATMDVAIRRTTGRSHAKTELSEEYNATTETWERTAVLESRVDDDRSTMLLDMTYGSGTDPIERTLFGTDGVAAARGENLAMYPNDDLQIREVREPWTAIVGYSFDAVEASVRHLEPADANVGWTLRSANESTLVYASTDPTDFHENDIGTYAPSPAEEEISYRPGSELRAVVDREQGIVERVVSRLHYEEQYGDDVDVRNVRSTVAYDDVGDVTVERPDSLAGPGPLETFWDVVYYA